MSSQLRITRALLLTAISGFLVAGPGQASEQAIVSLKYVVEGFAPSPYTAYVTIGAAYPGPGGDPFSATVGTGPTASVMWPRSAAKFTGMFSGGGSVTPGGYIVSATPYSINFNFMTTLDQYNLTGSLMKDFAPTNPTTFSFPATTTLCGGSCLPRYGTLQHVTRGTSRFGGTARLIFNLTAVGLKQNFITAGFSPISYMNLATPRLLQVSSYTGMYGIPAKIKRTTVNSSQYSLTAFHFYGIHTTGTVMARKTTGAYITSFSRNGSNNLNTTNLTGMISTVVPVLQQTFKRSGGVIIGIGGTNNAAATFRTVVTFLPEPAGAAVLSVGLLGMAALYRRRFM